MKLIYYNPLINSEESIEIKPYVIDNYGKFKNIKEFHNDNDICNILNDYLNKLDCSKTCEGMQIVKLSSFNYTNFMSEYMFYIKFFINYYLYNIYYDKIIDRHIKNILYEYNNPINNIAKSKSKKNKKAKNVYVRYTTKDIFTNDITYIYENLFTGDRIESSNPNLLDELNKPKVKKKKEKVNKVVSLNCMTFNFKRK